MGRKNKNRGAKSAPALNRPVMVVPEDPFLDSEGSKVEIEATVPPPVETQPVPLTPAKKVQSPMTQAIHRRRRNKKLKPYRVDNVIFIRA